MSENTITVDVCGKHGSPAASYFRAIPSICFEKYIEGGDPCGDWQKITLRREWLCLRYSEVGNPEPCEGGKAPRHEGCGPVWIGEADE